MLSDVPLKSHQPVAQKAVKKNQILASLAKKIATMTAILMKMIILRMVIRFTAVVMKYLMAVHRQTASLRTIVSMRRVDLVYRLLQGNRLANWKAQVWSCFTQRKLRMRRSILIRHSRKWEWLVAFVPLQSALQITKDETRPPLSAAWATNRRAYLRIWNIYKWTETVNPHPLLARVITPTTQIKTINKRFQEAGTRSMTRQMWWILASPSTSSKRMTLIFYVAVHNRKISWQNQPKTTCICKLKILWPPMECLPSTWKETLSHR